MMSKFGLFALAAAAIAFSPMVANACAGDHSAQLSDGTQLAQAQDQSPMQQMDNQGSSTQQQSPASQSDEDK
jgi:hypothetical protein